MRYAFILGESAFDLDILPKNSLLLFKHYNSIQKGSVSVAMHSLGNIAETRRWLTLKIKDWKVLWDSVNMTLPSSRYGAVSASLKSSILQQGKETGLAFWARRASKSEAAAHRVLHASSRLSLGVTNGTLNINKSTKATRTSSRGVFNFNSFVLNLCCWWEEAGAQSIKYLLYKHGGRDLITFRHTES